MTRAKSPETDSEGMEKDSDPLDEVLHRLGYDAFRLGQREAVETLLEKNRLLLVAPTGGGKSLTYQLPACLLTGTTVVISPLIALMEDQVTALEDRGVAATFLASTLDNDELRQRMSDLADGHFQLAYVAPERLAHQGFRSLLWDIDCPLVAIDEAHCISEWGHDFRPEYMLIGDVIDQLSQARVLACTATATPIVRDEILERLHLPANTPQVVHGFARPNLALRATEVRGKADRERAIDAALAETLKAPGSDAGSAILYAPTRRSSEEEAGRLASNGWRADCYHAGLQGHIRSSVQEDFIQGDLEVVVATNAFGMGIDRADVRLVGHLAPPGSVESYYQEVGRAGRDGSPAVGLLLCGPSDMALRRRFIESDAEATGNDDLARHKWNMFLELMRWIEGGSCRHDAILRYFGDEAETLAGCGRCDVCVGLESSDQDAEEISIYVRKALSGVARVHGRFGTGLASKLLKGVADDRLEWSGLSSTSTFGVLSDKSIDWITRLLRRCVTAGWVDFRGGDRPLLVLTSEGHDVMLGKREARLLLPRDGPLLRTKGRGERQRGRAPSRKLSAGEEALSDSETELFEALREHRLGIARADSIAPYVVASDRTLRDLARRRPTDLDELQQVHGIGPSKAERFGKGLLNVVHKAGESETDTVVES
jgi:ATP-dependent DNA helicase RecQ